MQRCGDDFCELPLETCVEDRCVQVVDGPDSTPVDAAPPGGRDTGGMSSPLDAAVFSDLGPMADAGPAADTGDARPPDAPILHIDAPADGAIVVEMPVIEGHVDNIAPDASVRFAVEDTGIGGPVVVTDGRFRVELDLPPGRWVVTITIDQGRYRETARVEFRFDAFVRVEDGQLRAGSSTFRFVALNAPSLHEVAWHFLQGGGTDHVAAVFDKARSLGVTVVRTRAYDDRSDAPSAIQRGQGQYNATGMTALDFIIARAGDAGVKLLLPLVDGGDTYGGINQYLEWHGYVRPLPADRHFFFDRGAIREHVKAHVRQLLTRVNTINGVAYRDDPTILGWEIIDGLDAAGAYPPEDGGEGVEGFLRELTNLVAEVAPHHLVGTGDTGVDVNPTDYERSADVFRDAGLDALLDGSHGTSWLRNLRLRNVHFATLHITPDAWGFPAGVNQYSNLGAEWMRGHARLAAREGKPLVVVNARLDAGGGLDLANRRTTFDAWLNEFASLELAGFTVGNFYHDTFEADADPHAWFFRAGTEPDNLVNEYADLVESAAVELLAAEP